MSNKYVSHIGNDGVIIVRRVDVREFEYQVCAFHEDVDYKAKLKLDDTFEDNVLEAAAEVFGRIMVSASARIDRRQAEMAGAPFVPLLPEECDYPDALIGWVEGHISQMIGAEMRVQGEINSGIGL